MGVVSSKLGDLGVVTTTLDTAVNWARTGAMWPLLFGLVYIVIVLFLPYGIIGTWRARRRQG